MPLTMKLYSKFSVLLLVLLLSCKPNNGKTIDLTPPQLVSIHPANGAVDVSENTTEITLIFNENVTLKIPYSITLNGMSLTNIQPGIQKELKIPVSGLKTSTIYTLIIPENTIKGPSGALIDKEIKSTFTTYTPPARNFSAQAKKVMDFFTQTYGKKTISGTMANVAWNIDEANWVFEQTGKYPALNCFDYIHHVYSPSNWIDYSNISLIENWWNANGLVSIMWHWCMPKDMNTNKTEFAFYSKDTNFDVSKISDVNSPEYKLMVKDIDIIAGYLKLLQNKNIPVIWRPLHEASGNTNAYTNGTAWFWWGMKGPAACKALWKLMFERLNNHHGLDNLIWVWTSQGNDPDWYPGDEYVDIVGRDLYPETNIHASQLTEFNKVKAIVDNHKMIALSECGGIPDPDLMFQKGDTWLWFMPWYGAHIRDDKHNGAEYMKKVMSNSNVITRDQMPSLK